MTRGAYVARALAGITGTSGVVRHSAQPNLDAAWANYCAKTAIRRAHYGRRRRRQGYKPISRVCMAPTRFSEALASVGRANWRSTFHACVQRALSRPMLGAVRLDVS